MTVTWSEVIGFSSNGTRQPPDEDGVYVIAEVINNTYHVRYVGKGNILERMDVHTSSNEPNTCLKTVMSDTSNVKIRHAIINNETDRTNVEYTFWKYYTNGGHQLCNEIAPTGRWLDDITVPF